MLKTFSNTFFKQAELLIEIMPVVATERCFALKGGTAINFFLQEMPRLSIDIDLTYLPISGREESLSEINLAILLLDESLKIALPETTVYQIKRQLTLDEKQFLITLAEGLPDWSILKIPHLADLPALQWKLMNIKKMELEKRNRAVKALKKCF